MNYPDYLTAEDNLHIACCNYLDLQHKGLLYTHPANEGKRTKFEQFKNKMLRMKPGVPDLLIFKACGGYNGLAIEFKIGKNKPTEHQAKFMQDLEAEGWRT
jgi:hypothetical protein